MPVPRGRALNLSTIPGPTPSARSVNRVASPRPVVARSLRAFILRRRTERLGHELGMLLIRG